MPTGLLITFNHAESSFKLLKLDTPCTSQTFILSETLRWARFGLSSRGHVRLPAATLAPPGPGSLWWSCRPDRGWSEPRRSPAGWSLFPLYREQELTLPLWDKHDCTRLQLVRVMHAPPLSVSILNAGIFCAYCVFCVWWLIAYC